MDKLTKGALVATIGLLVIVTLYMGKGWLEGTEERKKAELENNNLRQQVLDDRKQVTANERKMQDNFDRLRQEGDAKLAAEIATLRKEVDLKAAATSANLSALEAEKEAILESVRKKKEEESKKDKAVIAKLEAELKKRIKANLFLLSLQHQRNYLILKKPFIV